jgi:hypothetical protein
MTPAYGRFLALFHPAHEYPGVALEPDLPLVERLRRLG